MDNKDFTITKGTAEVYKVRHPSGMYWADISIYSEDKASRIQIASDYGTWQYYWNAGGTTFKEFLAGMSMEYAANKFGTVSCRKPLPRFKDFWQFIWPVFLQELKRESEYCADCNLPYSADYKIIGDFPRPTEEDTRSPIYNAIFESIKGWKDIKAPDRYTGTLHADGKHAKVIYDAINQAARDNTNRKANPAIRQRVRNMAEKMAPIYFYENNYPHTWDGGTLSAPQKGWWIEKCAPFAHIAVDAQNDDLISIKEMVKSDLVVAIELQEQEQGEVFNSGREFALKYVISLLDQYLIPSA